MVSSRDFWIKRYNIDPHYRNLFPYDHVVSTIYRISSQLKRPIRILELGAGCGNNLLLIPSSILSSGVGIDVSATACEYASTMDDSNRFDFITHDLLEFPYPINDNNFDLVLDRSCLSLFDKPSFGKIFDSLKKYLNKPYFFYSNPYSDLHASRPCSGPPMSSGSNIGTITAAEAFYYSRNDIIEIFSDSIIDLRLASVDNFTHPQRIMESEWRILAYVK